MHNAYVLSEYLRRGLGTPLLRRVAAKAEEGGCGRSGGMAVDRNTDAHRFYEDLETELPPKWRVFSDIRESLLNLAEDAEQPTKYILQRQFPP